MLDTILHDQEFAHFRQMIHRIAGISMSPAKKALVAGRLAKRLKHLGKCEPTAKSQEQA